VRAINDTNAANVSDINKSLLRVSGISESFAGDIELAASPVHRQYGRNIARHPDVG